MTARVLLAAAALAAPAGFTSADDRAAVSTSVELRQTAAADAAGYSLSLAVVNKSSAVADDVVVSGPLPEGVKGVAADPLPDAGGKPLTWTLGPMKPGEERLIRLKLTMADDAPARPKTRFRVSAKAVAELAVELPPAARDPVRITTVVPDGPPAGKPCAVQFRLTNTRDRAVTGVSLGVTLPDGLTHPAGSELENPVGTLEPGQTRTITLTVTPARGGDLRGSTIVTADGAKPVADTFALKAKTSGVGVVVTAPAAAGRRATVAVAVTVRNDSDKAVAGGKVRIPLPAGLAFAAAADGGRYAEIAHAVEWDVGDIAPGDAKTMRFTLVACDTGGQTITAALTTAGPETATASAGVIVTDRAKP